MTTEELMKDLNGIDDIYASSEADRAGNFVDVVDDAGEDILMIGEAATNWLDVVIKEAASWVADQGVKEQISEIVTTYLGTPLNRRAKRYRLRWMDDADGEPIYMSYNKKGQWFATYLEPAAVFTESELEKIKQDNPGFASVIDKMKEEVKW